LLFRYVNSTLWSKPGHFNSALSKGASSTTWIWNLHSDAHDYLAYVVDKPSTSVAAAGGHAATCKRKVFSSNLAHLSLVLFWLSGMHFHGAYFSNYGAWLKDAKHCLPCLSLVSLVHQDILNSYQSTPYYFQGIRILSGLFQLWRAEGILTSNHLKYVAGAAGVATILSLAGSYFHMHCSSAFRAGHYTLFYKKFRALSIHHLSLLLGLASIAFSAHQYHISAPLNLLLQAGISPLWIPSPQDLFSKDLMEAILSSPAAYQKSPISNTTNDFTPGYELAQTCSDFGLSNNWSFRSHHFYVGVVLIIGGIIGLFYRRRKIDSLTFNYLLRYSRGLVTSFHAQLATQLAIFGSSSAAFAHLQSAIPVYPFLLSDYATSLSLFCHHMWVASFLMIGSGAHASIFCITDYVSSDLLKHRDVIISHLIWVNLALGLHSFGLYIHNDTLQALGRPQDIFADNSIQLKPVFAVLAVSGNAFDVEVLDGKLIRGTMELGTADFMVHHLHAFTIHLSLLILLKGILYARSSRLVSDKLELGFRYPCDGPGRGGTCQISPWDHIYLALFWMYNSLAVLLFHYFWKMQSDIWALMYDVSSQKIVHMSGGDFSVNSITINGWLRNFLWSQAAQVIQSYASPLSSYGLIFLGAHFVWAFSLMFLYSGRGYWQELIESILWAHHKLKIVMHVQPRALSISQGRAVGLAHYLLGGTASTWAFFLSRVLALSA
jgi:photosystem I P700 chlorophyll a apoprotein A1